MTKPACPIIAIEEHYWDKELAGQYAGVEGTRRPDQLERLYDLGALRIREMDEAGVDIQVISHGAPSLQKVKADIAVALGTRVNDRLAAAESTTDCGGKSPIRRRQSFFATKRPQAGCEASRSKTAAPSAAALCPPGMTVPRTSLGSVSCSLWQWKKCPSLAPASAHCQS